MNHVKPRNTFTRRHPTQQRPSKSTLSNALCGLAAAILLCASPVHAQSTDQGPNDAVYQYHGADRDQQLVDKARQEGTFVWYTSMTPPESGPLAQAFEKKYGIKVDIWRASGNQVMQRTITEGQARHYAVDVIETSGAEVEMIAREKLLSQFYSPYLADLPPDAIAKSHLWVYDRFNFFVVAYNTKKFKREDIPTTYEGFLDPKWKGQIGIEVDDAYWMATIIKKLGAERGNKLFQQLSDMKPDVRTGHIVLTGLVAAGEVPVSLTNSNSAVESLKRRGAPIDWVPVQPVVGEGLGLAVMKNAPHPYAALLFTDFILSPEGQELLNTMGRVPASTKVKSYLKNFPFTMMDSVTLLDEDKKWQTQWDSLFIKK
jgi:iron(III) transport system substrate-binding protein